MSFTAPQRLRQYILYHAIADFGSKVLVGQTAEMIAAMTDGDAVEALYERFEELDGIGVAYDLRGAGDETGIKPEYLHEYRHFEVDVVALKMLDGSWVAWNYYHGGGKFTTPETIPWIETSFFIQARTEIREVTVFSR